jgi:hypothetical protein
MRELVLVMAMSRHGSSAVNHPSRTVRSATPMRRACSFRALKLSRILLMSRYWEPSAVMRSVSSATVAGMRPPRAVQTRVGPHRGAVSVAA